MTIFSYWKMFRNYSNRSEYRLLKVNMYVLKDFPSLKTNAADFQTLYQYNVGSICA